MSDACYLRMIFPKKDLPKFNEILEKHIYKGTFWDEEDGDVGIVDAVIEEANYGWHDEIQQLAKAGLTFNAITGAGSNYGPAVRMCYKGEMVECDANWEHSPVVTVSRLGCNEDALKKCKHYWELYDRMMDDIYQDKIRYWELYDRMMDKTKEE